MSNTGNIIFTSAPPAPIPPGPPFPASSAANGLSVDSVTGQIILGNSSLYQACDIDLAGFLLNITSAEPGTAKRLFLSDFNKVSALGDFDNSFPNSNSYFVAFDKGNADIFSAGEQILSGTYSLPAGSDPANSTRIGAMLEQTVYNTVLEFIPNVGIIQMTGGDTSPQKDRCFNIDISQGIYEMGALDGPTTGAPNATQVRVEDATDSFQLNSITGASRYAVNGFFGATGTFTDSGGLVVTVTGGIITDIT